MHLYFLLKAFIMIVTAALYIFYLHHLNFYDIVDEIYGLKSNLLLIQTTLEMIFFILLLIGLDRRVNK
jgi:hypothetical protein